MNFMKESIKDLPNHDYDSTLPTCWILEGLVMYLDRPEVINMLTEMTTLSPKGSYIILNYTNHPFGSDNAGYLDYMDAHLRKKGWTNEEVLKFGDDGFNYGRFHLSKKTDLMGFAIYSLN